MCKEEKIDLLLFASPTALYPGLKGSYQTVESIASAYDVDYIDFNYFYDEMGLDFETDFADENHLNQSGCPKFSCFFADYISTNYILEDHRGDDNYQRWQDAAKFYDASAFGYELSKKDSLDDHLQSIFDSENRSIVDVIWVYGDESETVQQTLGKYGIPTDPGIYQIEGGRINPVATFECNYTFDFGVDTYSCDVGGMSSFANDIMSTNMRLSSVSFDYFTYKIVDSCIYAEDGTVISRPADTSKRSWVGMGD